MPVCLIRGVYGLTWARIARCADLLSVLNVAAKWLKCPTLIKLAEIGVSVEAKGVTRHSACIVLPSSSGLSLSCE